MLYLNEKQLANNPQDFVQLYVTKSNGTVIQKQINISHNKLSYSIEYIIGYVKWCLERGFEVEIVDPLDHKAHDDLPIDGEVNKQEFIDC